MREKTATACATEEGEGYADFERRVRERVAGAAAPVFTTDADPDALWSHYLANLPPDRRQHYNCHCCRRFVCKYGPLVTVDGEGVARPLLWDSAAAPEFFRKAVGRLEAEVAGGRVSGVFVSDEPEWGVPRTGEWTHLAATPNPYLVAKKNPLKSPSQRAAELKEDYGILCRSLADYPHEVVTQALRVLTQDALYRSEKAKAVADWFFDLHIAVDGLKGKRRENVIWRAVAKAPAGFCHVRSTVLSTLLDDIKAGLPFDAIARRWGEKLHPLQYQRPTAPPTDGAIKQAEKVVAELGLERSFGRRFATLDDVLAKAWVPTRAEGTDGKGGFFAHLRQKQGAAALEIPAAKVTWEKFSRTVLPTALGMEVVVPASGSFYGLVTATDPAAPPLLQWDGLDGHPRNPVSWYFYSRGSMASRWGLAGGKRAAVTAVFLGPHRWQEPAKFDHQGDSVFFALEGAADSGKPGLCLFPEILKADLHGVRKVIEAHSRRGSIDGAGGGNANGIALQKNSPHAVAVRVRTATGFANYTIDRWD
jgi:hypothetical protein